MALIVLCGGLIGSLSSRLRQTHRGGFERIKSVTIDLLTSIQCARKTATRAAIQAGPPCRRAILAVAGAPPTVPGGRAVFNVMVCGEERRPSVTGLQSHAAAVAGRHLLFRRARTRSAPE